MERVSQQPIDYGGNDKRGCRGQEPAVRHQHVVLLQRAQHVSPARYRFADAQPEKRQCRLCRNVLWDKQCRLGQQYSKCFRENMAEQEVKIGSAKTSRSSDEITPTRAENYSSHKPRWPCPPNQTDHAYQKRECFGRAEMEWQECPNCNQEIEPWQ